MVAVDCVWPARATLGEGPLWDVARQALWWVDIKGGRLHRFRPADGARASWTTGDAGLSCLALDAAGGLVGTARRGWVRVGFQDEALVLAPLAEPGALPPRARFNDGKVAPDGAMWAGTMDDDEAEAVGDWWRLDASGALRGLGGGFMVTNGPAFDAARGRTYLTDSAARVIYAGDGWDAAAVAGRRPWRAFEAAEGYPDGMTVDAEGRLWVAFWDGACVRALDPEDGRVLRQVELPARRPTSVAFGGPDLDVLFVTSAAVGLESPGEADGGLFAVTGLGVRGLPPTAWGGR